MIQDSATTHAPELPEQLFETTAGILLTLDRGIKEYDLIQRLREQGYFAFLDDRQGDTHALFVAHFMLFHILYRLQDHLLTTHGRYLEISALCIRLHLTRSGGCELGEYDPVRDYYLDLDNLRRTGPADVEALIASFWKRFERHAGREQALATLGLCDPVDQATIRRQYKRLAMQHHPDRGGDKSRLQEINRAANILLGK